MDQKIPPPQVATVIYDGECGFCSRAVQFILKHERAAELTFCAKQSAAAIELLSKHAIAIDKLDSIALVEPERVSLYSDASFRLAGYLRPPWSWLRFGIMLPRSLRDSVYKYIAKNRKRLSRNSSCALALSSEQRARFVENI